MLWYDNLPCHLLHTQASPLTLFFFHWFCCCYIPLLQTQFIFSFFVFYVINDDHWCKSELITLPQDNVLVLPTEIDHSLHVTALSTEVKLFVLTLDLWHYLMKLTLDDLDLNVWNAMKKREKCLRSPALIFVMIMFCSQLYTKKTTYVTHSRGSIIVCKVII